MFSFGSKNPSKNPVDVVVHSYRADIDGLRAISILGVILYHAFPSIFTGGFVGVDIFFVISGFLISSLIFKELKQNQFSILKFYQRRVLRIFPALFTILLFFYFFGWISLLPQEYQQLGKHIASGAGFIQNFTLLTEAGYFDTASELKPLMHLWSLAIEEQFYIAYPLLLLLAWRFRLNFLAVIIPAGILSFYFNISQIHQNPGQVFFLPHTRFWELLSGAALAYFLRTQARISPTHRALASAAGFVLIVGAGLLITPKVSFPGWWALAPASGAVLVILAGPDVWLNRVVLSSAPMRFIGLISYPLYLWHWPLLVFAMLLLGSQPTALEKVSILGLSFLMAWSTYAYIEHPLRFGKRINIKAVGLIIAMILIGALGYNAFKRDGLPFRSVSDLNSLRKTAVLGAGRDLTNGECGLSTDDRRYFLLCSQDKSKPIRYAVWGDSKGDALFWGLIREQDHPFGWQLIGDVGCTPMSGARRITPDIENDPSRCANANRIALRTLKSNRDIHTVVIGTAYRVLTRHTYVDPGLDVTSEQAAWNGLSRAISELEKVGKQVIFVIDNPTLPDPSHCMPSRVTPWSALNQMISRAADPQCKITYAQHLSDTARYRHLVSQLQASHPQLIVYNPDHLLCDLSNGVCPISRDGHFLYSYTDHLSDYGNGLLAKDIMTLIQGQVMLER